MVCANQCTEPSNECSSHVKNESTVTTCIHNDNIVMKPTMGCDCTLEGRTCFFNEDSWSMDIGWNGQLHRLAVERVIPIVNYQTMSLSELCGPPLLRWNSGKEIANWVDLSGSGWKDVNRVWNGDEIDTYAKWRHQFQPRYDVSSIPRYGTRNHHCSWVPRNFDGISITGEQSYSGWLFCGCTEPFKQRCRQAWRCPVCLNPSNGAIYCETKYTASNNDTCFTDWTCQSDDCALQESELNPVNVMLPTPITHPYTETTPAATPTLTQNNESLTVLLIGVGIGIVAIAIVFSFLVYNRRRPTMKGKPKESEFKPLRGELHPPEKDVETTPNPLSFKFHLQKTVQSLRP